MSCCVKSSLCWQLFKSVQKSGGINFKKRFFPVLDRFRALRESYVSLVYSRSELSQFFLFPRNSHYLTTDLTINFTCKSHDEFPTCTIENRTVVGSCQFSHDRSHGENVASACRVCKKETVDYNAFTTQIRTWQQKSLCSLTLKTILCSLHFTLPH